jgi:hypothetical protein
VGKVARLNDVADSESMAEKVGKPRAAQRMMISNHRS